MEIMIREYRSEDYQPLIEILRKEYGSSIEQETLEKEYITDKRSVIVAQTDSGIVAGCAFLEVQEDFVRPSKTVFVTYVAVREDHRKLGIGRRLFEKTEEICKQRECMSIELTSADFRTGAHAFYASLGFTKKKTTVFIKEL